MALRKGVITIAPKEIELINARVSKRVKAKLQTDAKKAGMSMTEYLERLIDGSLTSESTIDEVLTEIRALRKAIEKK